MHARSTARTGESALSSLGPDIDARAYPPRLRHGPRQRGATRGTRLETRLPCAVAWVRGPPAPAAAPRSGAVRASCRAAGGVGDAVAVRLLAARDRRRADGAVRRLRLVRLARAGRLRRA